jgi:hypothetical protein
MLTYAGQWINDAGAHVEIGCVYLYFCTSKQVQLYDASINMRALAQCDAGTHVVIGCVLNLYFCTSKQVRLYQ